MHDPAEDYVHYVFENYSFDYFEYGDFETAQHGYVQRESKRTVNSVWLQNLAVADFVFVLFLPISIDYVLRDFHWQFGRATCKINSFVSVTNMYASVLFLMVISLDRYISLVHLSWARKVRTVRRAWVVCGVVWGVAVALSGPALVFRDTVQLRHATVCFNNFHDNDADLAAARHVAMVTVRTVVGFLLPFAAISVSGVLITARLRKARARLVRVSSFSRMVLAVILAFFLCWAPFHVFSLMELTMHSSMQLHAVLQTGFPLATSLAFFNSCVNPMLYVLLGKKARRLLRQSCLEFTKRSLRELSQSVSATESLSAPPSVAAPEAAVETLAHTTV
ncbi:hypothetical protein AGOR_G00058480 [Albula goreensis]|uniref:G-protein coupled receptors family 1 profile domain-containing protein n=1 Tax=Albula goreensis TaxID=1534307 RepID=A0A8T3DPY4_9TELE|nr:hypothetical protein AGOR_G00058480 [Albula goreensis]